MIFEPGVEPVPHWKTPLVPLVPPVAVNVVLLPLQTVVVPEIAVGTVGTTVLFVNVMLTFAFPVIS